MTLHIATVNYYSGRFTELLARSVFHLNRDLSIRMFIYDNGSSDGSLSFVDRIPDSSITIIPPNRIMSQGSRSHGHALDSLLRTSSVIDTNLLCLIDSDCFSIRKNWLQGYVERICKEECDVVGATAYCPTISDDNAYLWPGFLIMNRRAIDSIVENGWTFMPGQEGSKPYDVGQVISQALHQLGLKIEYLNRTPPRKIGSVIMEKWSIDNSIDHFFAASGKRSFSGYFRYVYGDKGRGRHISKRLKAWRLFRQPEIRAIMSCAI